MMSEEKAAIAGTALIEMLGLKPIPNKDKKAEIRYATSWGSKSVEGLGRCIERIVKENTAVVSADPVK